MVLTPVAVPISAVNLLACYMTEAMGYDKSYQLSDPISRNPSLQSAFSQLGFNLSFEAPSSGHCGIIIVCDAATFTQGLAAIPLVKALWVAVYCPPGLSNS